MKVTVCEFAATPYENEGLWQALVNHVQAERSELVLLPEMPFYRWLAATDQVDQEAWESAVAAHEHWLARLADLAPATIISSQSVVRSCKNLNEGYFGSKRAVPKAAIRATFWTNRSARDKSPGY